MKNFQVDLDITVSKHFFVEANNEEEAKNLVKDMMAKEPDYHTRNYDAFLSYDICDVNESN